MYKHGVIRTTIYSNIRLFNNLNEASCYFIKELSQYYTDLKISRGHYLHKHRSKFTHREYDNDYSKGEFYKIKLSISNNIIKKFSKDDQLKNMAKGAIISAIFSWVFHSLPNITITNIMMWYLKSLAWIPHIAVILLIVILLKGFKEEN